MKRLIQIEAEKNKENNCVFNKNKVLEYTITTDSTIFRKEAKDMPSYSLGEKQVSGIKYDQGFYYGKAIVSVEKTGRPRFFTELMDSRKHGRIFSSTI